jgi:hypothetical protein
MNWPRKADKLRALAANEDRAMKARIPMLWLAVLTVYQSYVTTDALSTLKSVEANQEYTLKYMEKSASILKRFKRVRIAGVADSEASGS